MLDSDKLRHWLNAVATGSMTPDQVLTQIQFSPLEPTGFESVGDFARIDTHRSVRTGLPEVIWGSGKTSEQIIEIMHHMQARHSIAIATRIDAAASAEIQREIPQVRYSPLARIAWLPSPSPLHYPGRIHIISAGTADLPVAEEAALTAELCGFQVQRLWDVGVAGIHRLLHHREVIADADVLVVVAGMEGALASIVGGLADCPVIAVPTSIGYGASFNGLAALLTMLNSCSAGVGVVNIDNGFGAAILAAQILKTANRLTNRSIGTRQRV